MSTYLYDLATYRLPIRLNTVPLEARLLYVVAPWLHAHLQPKGEK